MMKKSKNLIDENELKQVFRDLKNKQESGKYILYNKYGKCIKEVAFSILKEEKDSNNLMELVVNQLVNLNKDDFPMYKEASWIYSYTKKETLKYLKEKQGYINYDELYEIQKNSIELDRIIKMDKYNKLVQSISEKDKEIVALKILSNLSFNQISKFLNKSEAEIWIRYNRVINRFKFR